MRTLNKVAMSQPMSVTTCNLDLENLITDVNRSIATLAITTLLKVCMLDMIDTMITFPNEIKISMSFTLQTTFD